MLSPKSWNCILRHCDTRSSKTPSNPLHWNVDECILFSIWSTTAMEWMSSTTRWSPISWLQTRSCSFSTTDSNISRLRVFLLPAPPFRRALAEAKPPECTFTSNYQAAEMTLSRKCCSCQVAWRASTFDWGSPIGGTCCAGKFCFCGWLPVSSPLFT